MVGPNCCSDLLSYGRRMLLVSAGALLLLAPPWQVLAAGPAAAVTDSKPDLKTVVIPVEGMACISCAATVKRTIKSMDGVSHVEVNLALRTAQVTYTPEKLSPDRIVAAVNKLGYRAGPPKEIE